MCLFTKINNLSSDKFDLRSKPESSQPVFFGGYIKLRIHIEFNLNKLSYFQLKLAYVTYQYMF